MIYNGTLNYKQALSFSQFIILSGEEDFWHPVQYIFDTLSQVSR